MFDSVGAYVYQFERAFVLMIMDSVVTKTNNVQQGERFNDYGSWFSIGKAMRWLRTPESLCLCSIGNFTHVFDSSTVQSNHLNANSRSLNFVGS